jgi:hypothetical protein
MNGTTKSTVSTKDALIFGSKLLGAGIGFAPLTLRTIASGFKTYAPESFNSVMSDGFLDLIFGNGRFHDHIIHLVLSIGSVDDTLPALTKAEEDEVRATVEAKLGVKSGLEFEQAFAAAIIMKRSSKRFSK